MMHTVKVLLYPLSWLYGVVTSIRNHLYDTGHHKSIRFSIHVISVGNLAVGGTGKTPMVEYLAALLAQHKHKPAMLSRGYKRKTKGFRLACLQDNAATLGDEPFQLWLKFDRKIPVAVAEQRVLAIPELLFQHDDRDVIICDDAYQHRSLKPNFNILLSAFSRPFFDDHLMPAGRLREARKGAGRADAVVFTKCPADIEHKRTRYIYQAEKYLSDGCPVFFSTIKYSSPLPLFDSYMPFSPRVLLLTGIADAEEMKQYVSDKYDLAEHLEYGDHHHYTKKDAHRIIDCYRQLHNRSGGMAILTTEKDAAKIRAIELLSVFPVFYLPIEIEFLCGGERFDRLVLESFQKTDPIGREA